MSAGELFDLVRPIVLLASALASTWVLASARKRFQFYLALLWAGATFFLPLVVLPLYIVIALYKRRPQVDHINARFSVPLVYLLFLLSAILAYEYVNNRSVDAHLARASFAKTNGDPLSAMREYREALKLEDNAHTHKLLGLSLMEAGYTLEAITEFRTAELKGEEDDNIHYYLGILLDRINMKGQSIEEFNNYTISETCLQTVERCEDARQRVARGLD